MKNGFRKFIKVTGLTIVLSSAVSFTSFASMNLEAGAPVSGIAVAMNNYFAKTMEPEKNIAESVRMVKQSIVIGEEDVSEVETKSAAELLAEEVQVVEEEIITENGATYGTVKNTSNLRLREEPNMDSRTITLLSEGETYIVIGQEGDFLKIQVDDDLTGYVFKDYVTLSIKTEAEIEAERAARAAEQERLRKEAEEALRKLEEERIRESKAEESRALESIEESKAKESSIAESKARETIEEIETVEETEDPGEIVETSEETEGTIESRKETEETTEETKVETKAETKEETKAVIVAGPGGSGAGSSKGKIIGPGGSTSSERAAIVAYAKQFLGGKYVYGGTDLTGGSGVDCSGFTMRVYEKFGYNIGRTSRDQAGTGRSIDPSQAQPGDLFFYASGGTINHVTMYIGDGNVIHASNSTTGIIISNAYYRTPCKVCTYLD